jgi:phosphoesterase RecJ-like protein
MIVPRDRFEEFEAGAEDLEGFVDIPRSIAGTEVGLLFRLTASGDVKISFRSNGSVDVNVLARLFKGGGHVKASGAVVPGPMDEAVPRVLDRVRQAVSQTRGTS